MHGNPYTALISELRKDNYTSSQQFFRFGKVTSIDPLKVEISGTIQQKDTLIKNSSLSNFYVGDKLLLLPISDNQKFIILCKVVNV